ncbi:MAG: 2-amino-4-hydroxy-6-hydroxymethyldihydropteridine diphosphokinase [Elusimicrobiota bacterium]|nr:2-amino-4-hydroxy-6-hydroxymethyldihydropteridine diphosphokinase [Elusimicrobiota bacterium]
MRPVTALLLLGANLGDREKTLRRAVAALARLEGCRLEKVSRLYETAPVGPSDRPYLNAAVRLRTTRTPLGLLLEAKRLEAAAGRRPGARWCARPLDVDLVSHGTTRLRTPWLSVPHPLMASRPFAAAPLADLSPVWRRRYASMKRDPRKVRIH